MGGLKDRWLVQQRRQERRANARFPLALEVRYTTGRHRHEPMRKGRTIDLSSSALRFTADAPVLTGQALEVYIDWPALLDGSVRLQLVVWGVQASEADP